ncbi:MAG: hypothetical protein QOE92_2007 [Chloroflexota bacterium]|jgi:GT2 family glycosyltransferase|nr:hypothetical protein [Chloroflexota bacterium]
MGGKLGSTTVSTRAQVSAVIVNFNGGADLIRCVASLHEQADLKEILVVDNGSTDGSPEELERLHPGTAVLRSPVNDGYTGGANRGAAATTGDLLLFMNPDVVVDRGSIAKIARRLRDGAGVVGPRLLVEADDAWEVGATLDSVGFPVILREPGRPLYVSGCALATRRDLFQRLAGFDERYFMIAEDADYSWRALLSGADVAVAEGATALHRGGGSTPGGYMRAGRHEVTRFRVARRERNMLATRIKCLPAGHLLPAVVAQVGWILAEATGSILMGRPGLAWQLMAALGWNIVQLPETLRRRRLTPVAGDRHRAIQGRLHRGLHGLQLLRASGLPRYVG